MKKHSQVLIIGGGNAGLSLAALLLIKKKDLTVSIIEPSEKHYYQPAWTLVGGGAFDIRKTVRKEAEFIPEKAIWIKEHADKFDPENNAVITREGNHYTYDYLVVCPGIQLNWTAIKGLKENLGKTEFAPITVLKLLHTHMNV